MDTSARPANRLVEQTSPYLLQHAYNPVDWNPWNAETLERARREGKPILLSIGYSACHWCHVMEHESFEDADTAALMNSLYVNVKVDREERPDLDKIYQLVHQMLTQRPGGWPLTVFLTPDTHAPIFAGTYFPPQSRYGMPSFGDVLRRVADHYAEHRDRMDEHTRAITDALARMDGGSATDADPGMLSDAPLAAARSQLEEQYDPVHGGFGGAPKFPHPTNVEILLRHWSRSRERGEPDDKGLAMAVHTLQAMAAGGIYDHVGGGFCRYSVDARWMIPHFEKMLYDNAQLMVLYADASLASGEPSLGECALDTAAWVMREMQSDDGGYYSTLDADSEGEEGKYYVWTTDELRGLLDDDEWRSVEIRYGLRGDPNFEGKWHLNVASSIDTVAQRAAMDATRVRSALASARAKLFTAREQRVRPGLDDKILTSWNGLMIKGMAHAGRLLDAPELVDSAARALDFVRNTLWRDDRLMATTRAGKTHLNAYLDDYVILVDGIVALSQARWREGDLEFACQLADTVLERFADPRGGFFFTSDDHERLLHRSKPAGDDATPSGNGVAAQAFGRLGHLLGEPRYLEAAERVLQSLWGQITSYPAAHGSLLVALDEYANAPQSVVLRGDPRAMAPWQRRCHDHYRPSRTVVALPAGANPPGALAARRVTDAAVTAYLCRGLSCSAPITDLDTLSRELARP